MAKVISKTKTKGGDIVSDYKIKTKTYSDGSKKVVRKDTMNGISRRKYKSVSTFDKDGNATSHKLKQRIFKRGGKLSKKC